MDTDFGGRVMRFCLDACSFHSASSWLLHWDGYFVFNEQGRSCFGILEIRDSFCVREGTLRISPFLSIFSKMNFAAHLHFLHIYFLSFVILPSLIFFSPFPFIFCSFQFYQDNIFFANTKFFNLVQILHSLWMISSFSGGLQFTLHTLGLLAQFSIGAQFSCMLCAFSPISFP